MSNFAPGRVCPAYIPIFVSDKLVIGSSPRESLCTEGLMAISTDSGSLFISDSEHPQRAKVTQNEANMLFDFFIIRDCGGGQSPTAEA